jgi:hypothetical protein
MTLSPASYPITLPLTFPSPATHRGRESVHPSAPTPQYIVFPYDSDLCMLDHLETPTSNGCANVNGCVG